MTEINEFGGRRIGSFDTGNDDRGRYVVSCSKIGEMLKILPSPRFGIVQCDDNQEYTEAFYLSYNGILPHVINNMMSGTGLSMHRRGVIFCNDDQKKVYAITCKKILELFDIDPERWLDGFRNPDEMMQWIGKSKFASTGFSHTSRYLEYEMSLYSYEYSKIVTKIRSETVDVSKIRKLTDNVITSLEYSEWIIEQPKIEDSDQIRTVLIKYDNLIKELVNDNDKRVAMFIDYLYRVPGFAIECCTPWRRDSHTRRLICSIFQTWNLVGRV